MKSLRGQFLIASPKLPDPNFSQSVVLMLEHHDQGALGLILNRPTNVTLKEVWEQVEQDPCHCANLVSLGGPVQ
ncbi:MAG: YqgE/AlgH family protein, partial [Planctomycetota bacterium]